MNPASFSPLDWVLIAVLAASTLRAFLRGFLLEIVSLAGLIAGIALASWRYPLLALRLSRWITAPGEAQVIAFLLIVLGVMLAAGLVGRLLRSSASVLGLGFLDRLFGAAFGFVRGWVLVVFCGMAFAVFAPHQAWFGNSQLLPYFLAEAHGVSFVVPSGLEQQISMSVRELKHKVPDWIKQPE